MLGLLSLEDHELWRFNADDLTDFYYTFRVTSSRAARNAIRMKFHSSEVSHFKSYTPDMDGQQLLVCLSTLAMGDSLAVEIAQQSHGNVLRKMCGAMKSHEVLRYRSPVHVQISLNFLLLMTMLDFKNSLSVIFLRPQSLETLECLQLVRLRISRWVLFNMRKNVNVIRFKGLFWGLILMALRAESWHHEIAS